MKALEGTASGLTLTERPIPDPGPGEVLIRIQYAGVNFADLGKTDGIPGSEAAGQVAKVGSGVTEFREGDRVAALLVQGAYAEYALAPASAVLSIPEGVSTEAAGATLMQGLTAYHCLVTAGGIQAGDRVMVLAAAGGVGGLAIGWAKVLGAKTVVGVTSSVDKGEHARGMGADQICTYDTLGSLGEDAVDLILDSVGGHIFEQAMAVLAPYGRIVVYGQASGPRAPVNPAVVIRKSQAIVGSALSRIARLPDRYRPSGQRLWEELLAGRLRVDIGGRYALAEAAQAWQAMASRQTVGKLLLIP